MKSVGLFLAVCSGFQQAFTQEKSKESFDTFKLLFSVFYITSLLWLPLLSCYGHPHHCHAVAALCPNSVSVLCLTVHGNRLSPGNGGVVEKYVVAVQRAFHAMCIFHIMVTTTMLNRIW